MAKKTVRAIMALILTMVLFVCALPFLVISVRGDEVPQHSQEPKTINDLLQTIQDKSPNEKTIGRPSSKS